MEAGEHRRDETGCLRDLRRLQHLVDHRAHELLLAADTGEVGGARIARQMARSYVGEPLEPVELLTARHDVEAGIGVHDVTDFVVEDLRRVPVRIAALDPARCVDVVARDAQINAAEGIHDLLESVQVDIEIVIDLESGQIADRLGHQLRTAARQPAFERGVDLVHPATRYVDPEIAREGHDDRLLQAGIRVHEHDRVRAGGAADVRVVAEVCLLLGGQTGSGVRPKQEVIAGALGTRARRVRYSCRRHRESGHERPPRPRRRCAANTTAPRWLRPPVRRSEKETPRPRRGHGRSRRWSGWGRKSSSPSLRAALGRAGRGAVLFTLRFRGSRPVTVG